MKLFVQRFHFAEVFEDSCRHPAKTNNSTKETGVQAGWDGEYSVGNSSSSICLRLPIPAGASVPRFCLKSQSCWPSLLGLLFIMGANNALSLMKNLSFAPVLQPFQAFKMSIYSIKFVSAMGWGLNPNYISSCVILFWSSRIVPLRLACYLLMLTCQCLLLQLIPSDR